jgi:hypothetical protein
MKKLEMKMTESSKRETLGNLMKRPEESESSAASRAYANSSIPGGPDQDLVEEHLDTLRKYAESQTEGNTFRPSTAEIVAPDLSSGVLSQTTSGFLVRASSIDPDTKAYYESSDSGIFVSTDSLIDFGGKKFSKNSQAQSGPDVLTGHDLLISEAESKHKSPRPGSAYRDLTRIDPATTPNRPIAAAVYQSLINHNVYHPSDSSPFLDYRPSVEGEGAFSNGIFSFQKELGVFNKNADRISIKELRKVAGDLLLKAQSISDGDAKTVIDSFADNGFFGSTLDKLVLLPHTTQVGSGQISVEKLRARVRKAEEMSSGFDEAGTYSGQDDLLLVQTFKTGMADQGKDPFISSLTKADSASSYGTLNSPAEPFNGPFPAGMIMPVVYSIVAVGIFGLMLPGVISTLSDGHPEHVRDPESPQTLALGRNYTTDAGIGTKTLELFGFPRMENTGFFSNIAAGMMSFYGFPDPITPFSLFGPDFIDSLVNVLFAPGYYLVITKGILRDISKITEAFSNINTSSGVFGAVTSFFVAVESIFTSFTFKFFVTMAKTGQQIMKGLLQPGRDGHGGLVPTYNDQKNTRPESLTGRNRLAYSRIHTSREDAESPLSLRKHMAAWLSNEVHAALSTQKLPASPEGEGEPVKVLESHVAEKTPIRLTAKQVEYVEDIIDAEYVPFSIQDLRTNEIFSMPAFITSISDDFAVQHGTSHGYGRTDPVYSYAKTVRSINLVFDMIAMNERDHNYLYILLNKLTAMCYPQRDAGLIRAQENGQFFSQPFSQTPTASPVVRIRLGDLLASNKSARAMENIFGGPDILGLKAEKTANLSQKSQDLTAKRRENLLKVGEEKAKLYKQFAEGQIDPGTEIVIPAGTTLALRGSDKFATFRTLLPAQVKIKGTEEFSGSPDNVNLGQKAGDGEAKEALYQIELPKEITENRKQAYNFGGVTLAALVNNSEGGGLLGGLLGNDSGPTVFIKKSTKIDIFDEDVLKSLQLNDEDRRPFDEVQKFLDPETNPVVRSINNGSPGRGLAGVITQLSLSYEGSIWGTGEESRLQGLKAPKRIQVTLAFAPIHDLPLGLTSTGDLFAPSHPVGSYSRKTFDGKKAAHEKYFKENIKKANNLNEKKLKDPTETSLSF